MAQELDQQQARAILKDKGTRFLDYLAAVAQTFATKTPRRVQDSEEYILSSQIPSIPSLFRIGPSQSDHVWFAMRQPPKPEPVPVPAELSQYLNRVTIKRTTQTPKLNTRFDELVDSCAFNEEHPTPAMLRARGQAHRIRTLFSSWKNGIWEPWKTKTKPLEQASDLYQKMFDMYVRLDKDSDYVELLFGHCILTWSGRQSVDYPLILTGAHMIFKEDTGSILVEASTTSRMSVAPFEDSDLPGYRLLAKYQDAFNDGPVDVWDEHGAKELRQRIVGQLGVNAYIGDSLNLQPGEDPVLQRGWCLMLRKRMDNASAFYRGLSKKLRETDYLPEAFDSMFSDISTVQVALGDRPTDDISDRLLMPLPANNEQKRIIRQLADNSGVTVQGPPGTGKSHTIVNLIAHLLAHGKRVLVTAEKAQALAVLREKMPKEISDLAVASIGESTADAELLRLSVQRMQDSLTDLDVDDARGQIRQLDRVIDESDARLEEIDHELAHHLERQVDKFETTQGLEPAAQVAQWIVRNADANVIPDRVSQDSDMPLSADEYQEYVGLVRNLHDGDVQESMLSLPDVAQFPNGAELEALWSRLDRAHAGVNDLERSGLDLHAIDAVSTEQIEAILREVKPLVAELTVLDGSWERQLGALLRNNPQQREWLHRNIATLQHQVDDCLGLSGRLLGHQVSVPDGNPNDQNELLRQWEERVRQGKGLPRFLNKDLRVFGESVQVDGYTPKTAEELELVKTYIESRRLMSTLPTLLHQTFADLPVPTINADMSLPLMADFIRRVDSIDGWWHERYPIISRSLNEFFPSAESLTDLDTLGHAIAVLEGSVDRRVERELQQRLDDMDQLLRQHAGPRDSRLWSELLDSLHQRDGAKWQQALDESGRLMGIRQQAERRKELHDRLASVTPRWADAIMETHGQKDVAKDAQAYAFAWKLAQASAWLTEIDNEFDTESLLDESRTLIKRRRQATVKAVGLSARLHLKLTRDPDSRTSLNIWLDAMRRYGKGTGKNAGNYLATARRALPSAMNAMPVWIMPLHKVMDSFDPSVSQLFDVIIVDESSQCDLLSVGVLALAQKAVIVGDDNQTSPSNAFKSIEKMRMLQDRYIPDMLAKSLFTFDESLYSMSNRVFQSQIMLREHFRCVPEIIDYCNRFYGRQIFPLRERSHPEIGSPLQARYVQDAEVTRSGSDTVNATEAQAIADQIRKCCDDERYDDMSFGVVTLMSSEPHQKLLNDKIIEAIGAEEYAKRRMRVGNPPAFQGDERDVIFLSFVTEAAGGRSYAATRTGDKQWMNVAASRAKNQIWAFYSMNPSSLNVDDYRRGLIEYIRDYKVLEISEDPLGEARTSFEKDVIHDLLRHGYNGKIQSQYHVGRYVIDCVVDLGSGLRLAIACDGDEDKSESQFTEDVVEQRVLERLGWHFARVSAPEYYLDPVLAMKPVYQYLDDLLASLDNEDDVEVSASSQTVVDSEEEQRIPVSPIPSSSVSEEEHSDVEHSGTETDDVRPVLAKHGRHRENSAPDDLDDDYIAIEYGSLIGSEDFPLHGTTESDAAWLQAVVLMLVANEFPLAPDLLYSQIMPVLQDKRYSLSYGRRRIDGAVQYLITKEMILRSPDNYYYPNPIDDSFRIVQGRQLKDISVTEVAYVARRLSLIRGGKWEESLRVQIDRVYGWNTTDPDKKQLVDRAFYLLETSGLITVDNGKIIPSSRSLHMGSSASVVWAMLLLHLKDDHVSGA